jgi:uncharacterized damage-inducible protein DinB
MLHLTLTPAPGYYCEVGRLATMLKRTRRQTIGCVEGLTIEQLDHAYDASANTIGMLLSHLIAWELSYSARLFERRDLNAEEERAWGVGLRLGADARRTLHGHPVELYIEALERGRARLLDGLKGRDTEWLDLLVAMPGGEMASPYWLLFHLIEDEASHRGQMRWLRQRLPAASRGSASVLDRQRTE